MRPPPQSATYAHGRPSGGPRANPPLTPTPSKRRKTLVFSSATRDVKNDAETYQRQTSFSDSLPPHFALPVDAGFFFFFFPQSRWSVSAKCAGAEEANSTRNTETLFLPLHYTNAGEYSSNASFISKQCMSWAAVHTCLWDEVRIVKR